MKLTPLQVNDSSKTRTKGMLDHNIWLKHKIETEPINAVACFGCALAPILKSVILGGISTDRASRDLGKASLGIESEPADRIGVAVSATFSQSARSSGLSFLAISKAPAL